MSITVVCVCVLLHGCLMISLHDLSGFIVDVGIQLTLMFWLPAADEEYVLYVLSGLWGMSDGVWETQINGLYCWIKFVTRVVLDVTQCI